VSTPKIDELIEWAQAKMGMECVDCRSPPQPHVSDSVVYLRPKYLFITSEVLTMLQLVYTALASHRLSELSASAIFVQAAIVMHDLCDQQLSLAVLQLPPYIHLSNVNMSLTDQRCCA
jgi:hypothetical protein